MPVRDGDAKHAAAHLVAAAARCAHVADQVDYSIRRWVIPADETDRPAAAAAGSRAAVPRRPGSAPRGKVSRQRAGTLSDVQAAIARALGAEYDLEQPLPERLADLLRQLDRRSGAGGYRELAAKRT
jgi:hypothetical protein